jgi:hypothetical protein
MHSCRSGRVQGCPHIILQQHWLRCAGRHTTSRKSRRPVPSRAVQRRELPDPHHDTFVMSAGYGVRFSPTSKAVLERIPKSKLLVSRVIESWHLPCTWQGSLASSFSLACVASLVVTLSYRFIGLAWRPTLTCSARAGPKAHASVWGFGTGSIAYAADFGSERLNRMLAPQSGRSREIDLGRRHRVDRFMRTCRR